MSGGGKLIRYDLEEELYRYLTKGLPSFGQLPPIRRPLTRRQRLKVVRVRVKDYLTHLGYALINKCDREEAGW